jgi:hypothetical protein
MAAFPDYSSIGWINPLIVEVVGNKVLVSNFDELGQEQRKLKWLYPRRNITLSYRFLTRANARTIWQFYLSRSGIYEAFNFFLNYSDTYEGEYVGSGDGSTTVFNLPSKGASSYSIYLDSNLQTEGTDYTFTQNGGVDGADKVTFATAPTSGQRITYDFTGYLKIRCRFAENILTLEQMYNKLVSIGVKLKGLLNA